MSHMGVVLKVLVKKGPPGDPNQKGKAPYGQFGERYFEQLPWVGAAFFTGRVEALHSIFLYDDIWDRLRHCGVYI